MTTCTTHPDAPLVPNADRYLPIDVQGRVMQCVQAGHDYRDRHRCAYCGGPIPKDLRRAYRAVFCGTTHRVAAFRARKRAEAAQA